jgi:hypothetical protein
MITESVFGFQVNVLAALTFFGAALFLTGAMELLLGSD